MNLGVTIKAEMKRGKMEVMDKAIRWLEPLLKEIKINDLSNALQIYSISKSRNFFDRFFPDLGT